MNKNLEDLQKMVTFGDYEKEHVTFGDMERAGMTFSADREAFNQLLEMKKALSEG